MQLVVDILGWLGMISVLLAYALVSAKKMDAQSRSYQSLNTFGGLTLAINAWYYGAIPSVALDIIWMMIGMFMLYKISRRKDYGTQK